MDKYEYKVKLAQIEKLVAKKDYVTAAKIADGIDWRKVKSVTTLSMIADIYEANNRLEDCYEILNMVYDRSPIGRGVVYRMTEIATKMHDFEEAIDLYKEFVRIAPHDLSKYILKYRIYRERGSSVADQIVILEEFKSHEYDEQWAYELACLYEEAGMIDRCIEECDELILWFSEGEYVVKAMELKMKYQELSASQQEKYEHRYAYLEQKAAGQAEAYDEDEFDDDETLDELSEEEVMSFAQETILAESVQGKVSENVAEVDDTPQVSVINTNKFSTMNLQEELAKGLQMILAQVDEEEKAMLGAGPVAAEPIAVEETLRAEEFTAIEEPEVATEEFVVAKEPEVATEEFIATKEPVVATKEPVVATKEPIVAVEEPVVERKEQIQPQQPLEALEPANLSETAELKTEILKYMTVPQERKMEELLRTEEDGQISLAISEENILEKQITGQMTIGEILEAWEAKKRQAREQLENSADKRQTVLFETGEITSLLKDFIPRTPKDVPQMLDEIEAETAPPVEVPVIEPIAAESILLQETMKEEAVAEIPVANEPAWETFAAPEELEDDLPLDIDFAETLETVMPEPEEENEEVLFETIEAVPIDVPVEIPIDVPVEMPIEVPIEEPAEALVEELVEELVGVPVAEPEKESVSQNTASMLDAIERALAMEMTPTETAGKYLTEEQEKIFAYFISVSGMKKQLVNLLDGDSIYAGREDSREGNLLITGHPGNGKTTLAIDIVKAFQKQRREKGGKLAKVTGDGMNKKNPEDVVKKLGGGALIIEHAGGLNDETIEKLSMAMEGMTGGLLVILEDDSNEINSLMIRHPGFAVKFNRSIHIPLFSNDELVAFGKSYAEEQEYYFDEMAVLALYDSIGIRQTADHVVNIKEVKQFVDDAIAHAEKKSKGLFAKLSKKRIDEYGNKLLLEEDFDY